jgi:RHS repeat-associated protein
VRQCAYGYDGNGDTTAITSPVNGAYTDTAAINDHLQYDAEQRPITLTHLEGGVPITIVLGYNADGLRSRYTVAMSGTVVNDERFQYRDGELAQVSVVTATLTTSGTIKSQGVPYTDTYIDGPGGAPQEFLRQQGGVTNRYWYVLDGQGSVVAVTDTNGKVVDRYNYDSWGEQIGRYPETVPQQLRYRGYWYDSAVQWYWLTTRYYNPEDLRFLQPDPSDLDGVRTYAYVGDGPIDYDDPSGLDFWPDTFGCNHWYDQFLPNKLYCVAVQEYRDYQTLRDPHTPGWEKALIVASYIPLPGEAVAGRGLRVVVVLLRGGREVELAGRAAEIALRGRRYVEVPYQRVRPLLRAVGGCTCFPAGTQVATPHGSQAIQTLQVGQQVLAEDPATGQVEPEAVQAVIDDGVKPLLALALSDGEAITVTVDHPFYVDSGLFLRESGWLQAGQLQPGDRLRTADGRGAVVVGVRRGVGQTEVYTLTVAHDHSLLADVRGEA